MFIIFLIIFFILPGYCWSSINIRINKSR